jgi:hypothetical protein
MCCSIAVCWSGIPTTTHSIFDRKAPLAFCLLPYLYIGQAKQEQKELAKTVIQTALGVRSHH